MRKLLSANLSRLIKSKVFWTLEIFCLIFGMIVYSLVVINTNNLGGHWLLQNANCYFFFFIMYIGALIAVFSSLYIGTEYSDGTIRNKLFVGHCRRDIYFSNLAMNVVAGIAFCVTHMAAAILIGVPFLGTAVIEAVSAPLWRLGCGILIIVTYAAIFTFFSMMDSNKARSALISLIFALALLVAGMFIYGRLQEPEFIERMVLQEDGRFEKEQNVPNSRYITGTSRKIYEWIDVILPSAQGFHIFQRDGEFDSRIPFCAAGLTLVLTVCGIGCFQKKDIK